VKHPTPAALRHLEPALADLATSGYLRVRHEPVARPALTFCSNDYLALSDRAVPAGERPGASASRLVVGEHAAHQALEASLAEWLETASALTFTSGYAANVGVVSALAEPGDLIVSDALNHASLIDGARLSRATVKVVPHLDADAVERALADAPAKGRRWVVTESYFSMDADAPDLGRLRALCDAAGAGLIVDEAHALGVLGPDGRGLCAEAGIVPDVLIGAFGKAFGGAGGFVAGCSPLVAWLWNRARTFVFSTGMSPLVAATTRQALSIARTERWRRKRALAAADELRAGLKRLGADVRGFGPIVPVILGEVGHAMRVADGLRARGAHVLAIRPPSVPPGTARLRMTTTAAHSADDIRAVLTAFEEVLRCVA
jgi:8-amino-7-oxononanoate synthase